MELLPLKLICLQGLWESTLPFRSNSWGSKGLPSNGPELPPHLIQVHALKVAFGDRHDIGLVLPLGKLGKIGQSLLVANCHIDKLDGDAGHITLAAGQWRKMQRPQVA